jgi:hypothetical protein
MEEQNIKVLYNIHKTVGMQVLFVCHRAFPAITCQKSSISCMFHRPSRLKSARFPCQAGVSPHITQNSCYKSGLLLGICKIHQNAAKAAFGEKRRNTKEYCGLIAFEIVVLNLGINQTGRPLTACEIDVI